jgi:diguanylate cyclase (GGDEF)-like protein
LRPSLDWLYRAALVVLGPADEAGQRQDVIRRALLAPVIIALVSVKQLHIPGWQLAAGAAAAAVLYNLLIAHLVFIRHRFFTARILAFVLDGVLLCSASMFVLHGLGAKDSNSDIWLAFLVFAVSGGFVLAPIGSLIYTALAIGSFVAGTLLFFEPGSQFRDQLLLRVIFFAVFGLMSMGIAQELEKRRARLLNQNRQLAESKWRLEEQSAQLERALQTERERARRDALTGTLNHAAIVETLREQIDGRGDGGTLAVAMIDVDSLKAINDTFGHQTGDAVLVTVADAISRDGAIAGRYGGDEFVVIIPQVARAEAERYREALLKRLSEANLTDPESGTKVSIDASIGLALYPEEADSIEDLIKLSDSAMYASRRQRVVESGSSLSPRSLSGRRAAAIIGEIVPLLTAPGEIHEKLRLVAQRLAVTAGYETVDIQLGAGHTSTIQEGVFGDASKEAIEAWRAFRSQPRDVQPINAVMRRTRRAVLIDDFETDGRLSDEARVILRQLGLRSGLIAPMIWQNDFIGSLAVGSKQTAAFSPRDAQFLVAVASQVTAIVHMATLVERLQAASSGLRYAQTETVLLLAAAAEAHDRTTGMHLLSIRAITETLARELRYSAEQTEALGLAAVLHDIGKIRVPDVILSTPGQLSDEEWGTMKQHTVWGAEFLKDRPGFYLASVITRSHHERWDGTGYPDGLRGQAIPEVACIVAVADTFDAMVSDRPYRMAQSVDTTVREIAANAGKQFSPKVVEALLRLHQRGLLGQLFARLREPDAA